MAEVKSFIDGLFAKIKEFIIPIIISLITAPVLTVFNYKGLIQKEPVIDKSQNLVYRFYCTQDSINTIIFKFTLYSEKDFSLGNERFILMPVPSNITYVNSTHTSLSGLPDNTVGIKISRILKGEYDLKIPLNRISEKKFIDGKDGSLRISQVNGTFSNIRSYQFTDWFFFNPWKTAGIILILMSLIKLIIPKSKKDDKAPVANIATTILFF